MSRPALSASSAGPTNFSLPSSAPTPTQNAYPTFVFPSPDRARSHQQPDADADADSIAIAIARTNPHSPDGLLELNSPEPATALPAPAPARPSQKGKGKQPKDRDAPGPSAAASWFGFKPAKGSRSSSRLGDRASADSPAGLTSASPTPPPSAAALAAGTTSSSASAAPGSLYQQQARAPESTPDLSDLSVASQDRPVISRQHSLTSSPLPIKQPKQARKADKNRHRFQPFGHSRSKGSSDEKAAPTSTFRSALSKATKSSSSQDSPAHDLPRRSKSTDPLHTPRALLDGSGTGTPSSHSNVSSARKAHTLNMAPSSSSSATKDNRFLRAAGNLMSKIRSGASKTEAEHVQGEPATFKVIHLHLIEQTRKTRISQRLIEAVDKTEFWMPAFPYRCIDYLNYNASNHVGIYRVPGSERDVQKWKMRFDTELDVDLIQDDPGDINIVGSMFKSWLRDLPDEIFPKAIQDRIAAQNPNAEEVPQMLKDEISKLPPYNYYLLFAITCHISLLHNQQEENKMDYANLCICFQPCIRLNAFCFSFLIKQWKHCWQGCWTENEYVQLESQWDMMELHGDFSGPRTLIETSPYYQASRSKDHTFGLLGDMSFSGNTLGQLQHAVTVHPSPTIRPASKDSSETVTRDESSQVTPEASMVSSSTQGSKAGTIPTIDTSIASPQAFQQQTMKAEVGPLTPNSAQALAAGGGHPVSTTSLKLPSLSPVQPVSPLGPF